MLPLIEKRQPRSPEIHAHVPVAAQAIERCHSALTRGGSVWSNWRHVQDQIPDPALIQDRIAQAVPGGPMLRQIAPGAQVDFLADPSGAHAEQLQVLLKELELGQEAAARAHNRAESVNLDEPEAQLARAFATAFEALQSFGALAGWTGRPAHASSTGKGRGKGPAPRCGARGLHPVFA